MRPDSKTIDCRQLVAKIAGTIEARVKADSVVSLESLRAVRAPQRPPVLWVIEDDEAIRRALLRIFENDGYRLLSAANAGEIDQNLVSQAPDLILLDIGLPWIDGFELATMMKAHQDLAKVPIVFISGDNSKEAMKRGFRVGAHDFISKPFDIATVQKTVRTLLQLS